MNAAGMRFIAINSRLVGYFEVEGRLTSSQSESAFFSPSRQLGVRVVCQILGTSQCEARIQGHPYLGYDPIGDSATRYRSAFDEHDRDICACPAHQFHRQHRSAKAAANDGDGPTPGVR